MSSLLSTSICLTDLDKSKITTANNGKKYLNITVSVNDEVNNYGQNVSLYHSQTKEEREAREHRKYLGNGKVVWTDGGIKAVDKDGRIVGDTSPAPSSAPAPSLASNDESDLPF